VKIWVGSQDGGCRSQTASESLHTPPPTTTATMSTIARLAAQTLVQDTHIIRNPNRSDIAPSASADTKIPLYSPHDNDIDDDDRYSISSSILDHHERPARRPLPPLPDLRFEQSYMASIAPAHGVWWKVVLITLKDQVIMPLLQGLGFNLALFGWRWWNRGIKFSGAGLGGEVPSPGGLLEGVLMVKIARARRWWWEINNWQLPAEAR